MLNFRFTNQFKKDFRLAEKRRYDIDTLFEILINIIWEEPLPERCREHLLSGNYSSFTECHIKMIGFLFTFFARKVLFFPEPEPTPICFDILHPTLSTQSPP